MVGVGVEDEVNGLEVISNRFYTIKGMINLVRA
jgi:hypothetical protein